jgi:hypothetical protein
VSVWALDSRFPCIGCVNSDYFRMVNQAATISKAYAVRVDLSAPMFKNLLPGLRPQTWRTFQKHCFSAGTIAPQPNTCPCLHGG